MQNKILGTNFRWVVPQLSAEVWGRKQQFKLGLLDRLLASKTARKGIKYYSIAVESHADGNPHLDMLIIFEKQIRLANTQLDFLVQKHGDLTRYRTLNQAILEYGSKQDTPLTNLTNVEFILNEQDVRRDPVTFLMRRVDRDPFGFDFLQYCLDNKYFTTIQRWSYVKNKIKDYQQTLCNKLLKSKPGIRKIDSNLIRSTLTTSEQELFHSWSGYHQIVKFLNQILIYGFQRPFKSKQLLLVGPPNIGKTTLNRVLSEYLSTYEVGLTKWFPSYKDNVYKFFSWNEFSLDLMPYTRLLKFLEGTYINLETKGGSVLKCNNQSIIMNSNFSLVQHLTKKFGTISKITELPTNIANLSARIHQVIIPKDKPLFIITKLILPRI